jgi:hypothetical protein
MEQTVRIEGGGKSTRVVIEGKKEEERYKQPTVRDY